MPRCHFDVFDGRTPVDDAFADASEAMDQAAGLLMDVARDAVLKDGAGGLGVVVRDEKGVDLDWAAPMSREPRIDPARSRHPRTGPPASAVEFPDPILRARQVRAAIDETWRQSLDALADVSRTVAETQTLARPSRPCFGDPTLDDIAAKLPQAKRLLPISTATTLQEDST